MNHLGAGTHPQTTRSTGAVRRIIGSTAHGSALSRALAAGTAAAFAGGALLSQTVIVPGWRAMPPAAFLRHFAHYGPLTGGTVFGFEVASAVLLTRISYRTWREQWPGRTVWAVATVAMLGTFVTLIYFLPTNIALLGPSYPVTAVPATLTAWYRWNWVRTGLGLASAVLACAAQAASDAGAPVPPASRRQSAPPPDNAEIPGGSS